MKHLLLLFSLLTISSSSLHASEGTPTASIVKLDIYSTPDPRALIKMMPALYASSMAADRIEMTIHFVKETADTPVSADAIEQMAFFKYLNTTNRAGLHAFVRCLSSEIVFENCEKLTGITRDAKFAKTKATLTKTIATQFMNGREFAKIAQTQPMLLIQGVPYRGVQYLPALLSYVNSYLPTERVIASVPARPFKKVTVLANPDDQFGGRNREKEFEFLADNPFVEFKYVNAQTPEGKSLVASTKASQLPHYSADKETFTNPMTVKSLISNGTAKQVGEKLVLNLNPTSKVLIDRQSNSNEVTLFVMSQCPYGVQAENGFIFAKENGLISKDLKLKVKFIVNKDKNGKLVSLHGDEELAENYRQITMQEKFPELYESYLKLRNLDYESNDWEPIARKVGMDVAIIKKEMKNAVKTLEMQHLPETAALSINSSPTILWENQTLLTESAQFNRIASFDPVPLGDERVQTQVLDARNKQKSLKK